MKILFYLAKLSRRDGGIFQYSTALLDQLSYYYPDHMFYVYSFDPDELFLEIESRRENVRIIKPSEGILHKIWRHVLQIVQVIFQNLNKEVKFRIPLPYDRVLRKYTIDIVHTPFHNVDHKKNVKFISTVHDIQELHFPEFFSPIERIRRARINYETIKNSSHIIVSYDHIKADLKKYFSVSDRKVSTVLIKMDSLWFNKDSGFVDVDTVKDFDLRKRYLFYPAATWGHKNHLGLIKAFHLMLQKVSMTENDICLVLTGHLTDEYKTLKNKVIEYKLDERVFFLGIVSENDLYNLYKKSRGVVVPTLYEAGSFPLMESIMLGVPVICSNVTSLPETIGDERFVFDPLNFEEMSDKMIKISFDDAYRTQNLANSATMITRLTSTAGIEKFKSIYQIV